MANSDAYSSSETVTCAIQLLLSSSPLTAYCTSRRVASDPEGFCGQKSHLDGHRLELALQPPDDVLLVAVARLDAFPELIEVHEAARHDRRLVDDNLDVHGLSVSVEGTCVDEDTVRTNHLPIGA